MMYRNYRRLNVTFLLLMTGANAPASTRCDGWPTGPAPVTVLTNNETASSTSEAKSTLATVTDCK